tara:strand:- start:4 stop:231 length:228 start_codon:yes stop_codon:yes gene_type:complete
MLVFCDYIADRIKHGLEFDIRANRPYTKVGEVGPVKMDLHLTEGYFLSTKKTIHVSDLNGKMYKVTIEEENDYEN